MQLTWWCDVAGKHKQRSTGNWIWRSVRNPKRRKNWKICDRDRRI